MSYIGKEPADSFISFAKQDFTTSATTSYTLDNAVTNENELALFINFVRQEPTTAYTASGTTLTLTSATTSSDDMYCVYLGQAKQTVNAPDGSVGSSQVAASIITGQTAETSIATDDTVLIHDTSAGALRKMTRANFVSGIGGANTPNFIAYRSGSIFSLSNATYTKVIFNSESFDTASAYDTSTGLFTVPSGQAGKYFLASQLYMGGASASRFILRMRLNNSTTILFMDGDKTAPCAAFASTIKSLSVGDTVQIDAYQNSGSTQNLDLYSNTAEGNYFYGYKIIE